jgi:ATP-dependent RNA helicase DeaD
MMTFAEIGVQAAIVHGLLLLGIETPTPVQEKVIPILLKEDGDWISLAQTGTGKTAAFGVPLIQLLDVKSSRTQALVLCPTRELCVQVARDMGDFARHVPGVRILAVYGGARIDQQISSLRQGAHIIVATPGRLQDLLRRGAADISTIRTAVLDEADEMLNMGFQEEISAILAATPAAKNTLLFSATMSREVSVIANRYMTDPREIIIGRRNSGAENVRHLYYMVRARDRYPALKRIVDDNPDIYGIIFCRTRLETQEVADKLMQDGYRADALHGDLSQNQRDLVMDKFRRKNIQMLIATDVAARGVDVNNLTHVINFNLPDETAVYTHRSGRTGRAGKNGTAISIIHQREGGKIRAIEKSMKQVFERRPIPSGREICEKQLVNMADTILAKKIDHEQIEPLLPVIREKLASLDREELIRRLVAKECAHILEYYRHAPDLNVQEAGAERGRKNGNEPQRKNSRDRALFTRFHVNVGKNDGIGPEQLIGIINNRSRSSRIAIGKIELTRNFCFIEADNRFADHVLQAFDHMTINNKKVRIEIAQPRPAGRPDRASLGWKKPGPRPRTARPRKNRDFSV